MEHQANCRSFFERITMDIDLVGGWASPLENIVSWDDESPKIWKSKKCSKPPARLEWSLSVSVSLSLSLLSLSLSLSVSLSILTTSLDDARRERIFWKWASSKLPAQEVFLENHQSYDEDVSECLRLGKRETWTWQEPVLIQNLPMDTEDMREIAFKACKVAKCDPSSHTIIWWFPPSPWISKLRHRVSKE